MNTIYFYIYLLLVFASLLIFTISRCYFKITIFDSIFYPNENNNILESKLFLASHIGVNFALGLLFGFDVIYPMLVKIAAFEMYLYFTEYCDIFKVAPLNTLIITMIISLVSYVFGAIFSNGFNKTLQM